MINADKLCRILAERQALHLQCYNVFGIVLILALGYREQIHWR